MGLAESVDDAERTGISGAPQLSAIERERCWCLYQEA